MSSVYQNARVLIVDCMTDNRRFVKSALLREGVDQVTALGTYDEAIKFLKKNKDINLVISGYYLEEHTGVELFQQLSPKQQGRFLMIYSQDESQMVFQSIKNHPQISTLKRPYTAAEFNRAMQFENNKKKVPMSTGGKITTKSKILIVDDFEMMRVMMKNAFMELGYQNLEEAGDGEEALEKLIEAKKLNEPFELIFSDWNMPEMDGLELFRCCRSDDQFRDIPFVMVTAENEKANVIKAITEGVSNYIVKPLTPETLSEKIEKVNNKVGEGS
jgi:two-component system chemotaxis response regulator CheY